MENTKLKAAMQGDIHDNERDEQRLQPDEAILELPNVHDIPGQEHINPPKFREFADVTISSDDEEGIGIVGFDDDEDDLNIDTSITNDDTEITDDPHGPNTDDSKKSNSKNEVASTVDEDDLDNEDADVTEEEKELLARTADSMDGEDDTDRRNATLDNTDDDGELLNEQNDASGDDLDIPGSTDDDDDEILGEEDEENNSYGLGGDRKD